MLEEGQRGKDGVGDGVGTHFDMKYGVWSSKRKLMKGV